MAGEIELLPLYTPEALQRAFDVAMQDLATDRQRRFVLTLLADPDGNAKRAATQAGYSAKTAEVQASQTLRYLKVQTALEAGRRLVMWAVMDADELRSRLALRSRASLANVLTLPSLESEEESEVPESDAEESPELTKRRAVEQERRRRSYWQLDLVKAQQTGGIHQIKKIKEGKYGIEIEMYDPLPAQEQLAKILKLSGDGGILKYIDLGTLSSDQVQRIADGEDALAVLLAPTTPSESRT